MRFKDRRIFYKDEVGYFSGMSRKYNLEELKKESREIEEALRELERQKEEVDAQYSKIADQEKELSSQLYKCRDQYEYSKIEMRLNHVSRMRRDVESRKEELELKLRGYRSELENIKKKIKYLTPRTTKFIIEYEKK